jgi:hypothetical protein
MHVEESTDPTLRRATLSDYQIPRYHALSDDDSPQANRDPDTGTG